MSRFKLHDTRTLYFNDRLRRSIDRIMEYPCTVVEAPMGYGKTTAVKEAMRILGAKVLWQNVYGQGCEGFWQGLCTAVSDLDTEIADRLRRLGVPVDHTLRTEAINLLHSAKFSSPTFLVIDDYHFVKDTSIDDFAAFWLCNLPENLHLIILTRTSFLMDRPELRLKGFVHTIGLNTLAFQPSDIKEYYRLCGVSISQSDLEQLFSCSEGWVSALYLFLLEYVSSGRFQLNQDVPQLVHQTVYDPLNRELKAFLNHVCLFDTFTEPQAKHMWQKENTPDLLRMLLLRNAFLIFDAATGQYHLHHIFNSCVRAEFEKLSQQEQESLWERAGTWHFMNSEFVSAMDCFYRAKNYDALLNALEFEESFRSDAEYKQKLIQYLEQCPQAVLKKHPKALLVFARRMFALNEPTLLLKACREAHSYIISDGSLSQEQRDNLLGEYEIIISYSCYNDLSEMAMHHKNAEQLLRTPSTVASTKINWSLSSPSIFCMYHRESGRLPQELELMKTAICCYSSITNGHGAGADAMMRSEAYYMHGDFEHAEIAAYQALALAEQREQWSLVLCADFLRARLALCHGDYSAASALMQEAREYLKAQKLYSLLHTLDLCEAHLYSFLGKPEQSAEWLLLGRFQGTRILVQAFPILYFIYTRLLLEQGEYLKLIGFSEVYLQAASFYPLCQVYLYVQLAAALEQTFHRDKAIEALQNALQIAAPDRLYMPFVENGKHLTDIWTAAELNAAYHGFLLECRRLYQTYAVSAQAIREQCFPTDFAELTAREQEIARLASQGLSNPQIGRQLCITEHTVKAHLKKIFEKLQIQSRLQLSEHSEKFSKNTSVGNIRQK